MGGHRNRDQGRFSSKRKMEAVLRVLKGEDLDTVSRDLGVTGATLADWRDRFLQGGQASLKSKKRSPEADEVARLKRLLGDSIMRNELLRERIRRQEEGGAPFQPRRSRK